MTHDEAMAPQPLPSRALPPDPERVLRLLQSLGWRELLAALLPLYDQQETRLHERVNDPEHHYIQGMLKGLRLVLEWPYLQTQQPTPFARVPIPGVVRRRARGRPPPVPDAEPDPIRTRQSYPV